MVSYSSNDPANLAKGINDDYPDALNYANAELLYIYHGAVVALT